MLFCDALLCDAFHAQFLPFAQLANHAAQPERIRDDRQTHPFVRSRLRDHQVPRVHLHDLVPGAARVQSEGDAAILAVLVAFAVAAVEHVFDLFRVERNQAEAVGNEFIGQDGGVGFDLDEINGHGGDFGQHGAAQRVGKSKVDVAEGEVNMTGGSL